MDGSKFELMCKLKLKLEQDSIDEPAYGSRLGLMHEPIEVSIYGSIYESKEDNSLPALK